MTRREYEAKCLWGHHHYLRLDTGKPQRFARCPTCGEPTMLRVLPPPVVAAAEQTPTGDNDGS